MTTQACDRTKRKSSIRMKSTISNVRIKCSNEFMEKVNSFKLGYKEYLKKRYIPRNNAEMLIYPYDYCKESIVINSYIKDELAGTVTIITGSNIPSSETFHDLFQNFRNGKLAEISRLAITDEFKNDINVLLSLINWSWIYAYHIMGCKHWVIEVNPRHKGFYEKFLGFNTISQNKSCEMVGGAPAVLMCLDLNRIADEPNNYKFFSRGQILNDNIDNIKCSLKVNKAELKLIKNLYYQIKNHQVI